jgi:hypothetical protein
VPDSELTFSCHHHQAEQRILIVAALLEKEERMLPAPARGKGFWDPALITIGIGILLGVVSFVVVTSQWGKPTTSIATAGFFGILLGILIFVAGCIWLFVKILSVVSRPR